MNTIVVNGKRMQVEGNSISINGNKIFVDGKELNCEELKNEVTIKWEGDLASLECHNAKLKEIYKEMLILIMLILQVMLVVM